MAVVTISRLLGSGGDEIALKVAQDLGYELVDNTLIVKIAEQAGISVENASAYDEKYQSKTVEWMKKFLGPRTGKILINQSKHFDPENYVEYCKTVIRGLSEKGNVVIVGRAGQFILKDKDNAFHVRIFATEKFRVEWEKARNNISDEETLDMIKKSDNMRKRYIEKYLMEDWDDTRVYHLILDSSKLGIDLTASIIVNAVENFSRTHEYIPGVRDRRRGKDRRGTSRRKGPRRSSSVGWTSKDTGVAIIRDGRLIRSLSRTDRRAKELRTMIRRKEDRDKLNK